MAENIDYLYIGGRIKSTASDEIAIESVDILDTETNTTQSEVNSSLQGQITGLQEQNFVTLTASVSDTTLADVFTGITIAKNTIYRVANWKGDDNTTFYNTSYYSEYTANGTTVSTLVLLDVVNRGVTASATENSSDLITSGGVYTELNNLSFSTNEKLNQVGIDSEPTAGSDNLVKSGGTFQKISYEDEFVNNLVSSITSGTAIVKSLPSNLSNNKKYKITLVTSGFESTDRWAYSDAVYLKDANNNRLYLDSLLGIPNGTIIENKTFFCFIAAEYNYNAIAYICASSYVVSDEKTFTLSIDEIIEIKEKVNAVNTKVDTNKAEQNIVNANFASEINLLDMKVNGGKNYYATKEIVLDNEWANYTTLYAELSEVIDFPFTYRFSTPNGVNITSFGVRFYEEDGETYHNYPATGNPNEDIDYAGPSGATWKVSKLCINSVSPDVKYTGTFKIEVWKDVVSEFEKKVDKTSVVQTTGTSQSDIMSQKATTDAIKQKTTFSTNEEVNDLGVDSTPTLASDNLIKSGGVAQELILPSIVFDDFEASIPSGSSVVATIPKTLDTSKSYNITLVTTGFSDTDRWASTSPCVYLKDSSNNRLVLDSILGITPNDVIENTTFRGTIVNTEYSFDYIAYICRSNYVVSSNKKFILTVEEIAKLKDTVISIGDTVDKMGYDERESIPDYYFANNYLPNKVDFIRNLMEGCMVNGDAFFFQTDEHWEMNAQHSPALIKYIADRLNISRLFDGGDTTHNIDAYGLAHVNPDAVDFEMIRRRTFRGRLYHIIGNHEYLTWAYTDVNKWDGVDFGNWHDFMYFQMQEYDNVVYGDLDKHYYYVDNVAKKIRYIILSSYKKKETPIQSGNNYYTVAEFDYSNEQLSWFTNVALNVEPGWTILIFTHNFANFTYTGYDGEGYREGVAPKIDEPTKPFAQAILNYNGNGEIAAVIEGHLHYDAVFTVDDSLAGLTGSSVTGKTFKCIGTACDAYNFVGLGEFTQLFNRDINTITEQVFDVVVLDKTQKKLTFVRIGAPAYNILEQQPNGKYPLFGDLEYREVSYGNE